MDNGFEKLERLIHAANFRHRVLTSNIANIDTPGYKARDVNFGDLLNDEIVVLATTAPRHIKSGSGITGAREVASHDVQSWNDKNNVELDTEVAKMTENGLLYEAAVKLFATKVKIFKNAVRGR